MANQTISVNRNFSESAISGLANGEDITLNTGAKLTINSDNRWDQNAAVIGNITIDSASGGSVLVDGRDVWWIPFSSSTGNVPALGTVGTPDVTRGGSNVGEFLGIWTDLGVAPSTAGGAMPSTGYIKLRTKSVTFAASDVLTFSGGATATLSSEGQRGWISLVGEYQQLITVPRLGKFEALGDWFYLDNTNGADDQQIKIPVNDVCPAVQIETSAGSGVYEWYLNAGARWNTATQYVPTDVRGKYFGQTSTYTGLSTTSGSSTITGFTNTTGITVGSPIVASAGFAAGSNLYVVSIVSNTSVTVNTNSNATTTGTVTMRYWTPYIELARRASNSCGYKPASGCKVRVPNIHMSQSTTAFGGYTAPTTIGDRWEFVTSSAGEIYVDKVWSNIYFNLSAPYSVNILNSAFSRASVIANTAAETVLNNCACGLESNTEETALALSNLFSGLTMTDVCAVRYASSAAGQFPFSLTDVDSPSLTRLCMRIFGSTTAVTRGNADARTHSFTRVNNFTMTDCNSMGGKLYFAQCINGTISGTSYADQINGTTVSTNAVTAAFDIQSTCVNIKATGFSNFGSLANVHPYAAIFSTTAGNSTLEFYEIGSPSAKYDCGSANATGVIVAGSVTLGLKLKRIYCQNTRTAALSLANTVQNVQIDNVWCDLTDSQAIPALNLTARGCGWTNSVTGQTSCYGRHWEDAFTSTTTGRILLAMNEPLPATASQAVVTSGTPKYTSVGTINMPTLGDQVVWEVPYWIIGHKTLANIAPTVTGTNTGNFTLEYQFMPYGGSYGGTWKTLSAANLTAETIPAFVNLYNQGGFKIKIRATVATGATTNALTYIRIDTTTDSTEYARKYPFENPSVGYTSTLANSNLSIYVDSGDYLAATASNNAGSTIATPPWDSNYSAVMRLRKPGYQPLENTVTVTNVAQSIVASQIDYSTIADTNPGALGITVTEHGAVPVTWNSKNFSITILTTDDNLTAAQVANYINYNVSQFATFNSYAGLAWPEMVVPDGSNYQTSRGRLFGSTGATLKGVRVVRSDGVTAVSGFSQMQADDGTYWVAPVIVNVSNSGLISGSRVQLYNVTKATQIENISLVGSTYSYSIPSGSGIDVGDTLRLRVENPSHLEAQQTAIASNNTVFSISQVTDTIYTGIGIDGSTVTNFTADYVNDEVDVVIGSDFSMASFYAWWKYNLSTSNGIANFYGAITAIDAANFYNDTDILSVKFDNTTTSYLIQTDNIRFYRKDGNYPCQRPSTGGGGIDIVWKDKVYVAETGTSGLTPTEAATLEKLNTLTEDVSGLRFTTKALEQAPSGGGGGTTPADIWAYSTRTLTSTIPTASDIRQEMDSNSTQLAAIRSDISGLNDITTAQIRTELSTELARIDVAISTRNATAPDNASITAIKAKTDNLPASPASEGNVTSVGNAVAALNDISTSDIRTELATELARIDVAVSTRNSVAPDNASITAIKAKTDNLPSDPADNSDILTAIDALPTASEIQTQLETTGGKIDKIDKKTNIIPALL